jgi:hypothetical protein
LALDAVFFQVSFHEHLVQQTVGIVHRHTLAGTVVGKTDTQKKKIKKQNKQILVEETLLASARPVMQ